MTALAEPAAGPGARLRTRLRSRTGMTWLALSVVYVVWGSTYLAIRFTIESMPPLLSAGVRFLSSSSGPCWSCCVGRACYGSTAAS